MTTIDKTKVKDDLQYSVTLNRAIQVGPSWVRPDTAVTLKGKVIKDNLDAIVTVANA